MVLSSYSSGDKVSGCVRLQAALLCAVARLTVTVAGCTCVQHRRKSRRQEEELLRYEEELRLEAELSTGDSDGHFLLEPHQTYSFQFGCELPPAGLVSSYKGKFGFVRYYARAVLDRPSQNTLQCEKEFEVEEPLDVNRPDLLAPAAASKQKKVTCLFVPDAQVTISAQIDRKGFCEGEDISINGKFENTCSRIVVPKADIIAKHSYLADGRTKELRQKLSAVRGNHIISGMCDMWQGKIIRVPKLRPSLLGCDIIKVDYALMIYLLVPGSQKLSVELPLVIGMIPYGGGGGSRTNSVSSCSSLPSAPPSYSDIHRDLRVEGPPGPPGPHTPLLHDYDGEDEDDGGVFMTATQLYYTPPPAYSEVDQDAVNVVQVF